MAYLQSCSWRMYQLCSSAARNVNTLGKTHFMYGTQLTFIERAAVLSEWALCHAAFENLHPWVNLSQSHVRSQLSPICCYCSFEHEGIPLALRSKHRNNKLQSKSDRDTLCLLHLGRSFEEMLRET